jgi:hypothetical protein
MKKSEFDLYYRNQFIEKAVRRYGAEYKTKLENEFAKIDPNEDIEPYLILQALKSEDPRSHNMKGLIRKVIGLNC